jgi:hypothetical protein
MRQQVVHFVFIAVPLSSVAFGLAPATAFFRDGLHLGYWPSELLYLAAAIAAAFVFGAIASKVEARLFARESTQAGELAAR